MLPLSMVYGALGLVLILAAVAATSLYLERKRLFTLADGAALAGAEAFALETVVVEPDTLRPALTPDAVETAVREYLASAPHEPFEDLTVTEATSADGQSATVSLSAQWRPPMLVLVLPSGIPLEVTAVARSVFW
ncbi:MAG TPA: pilus assembly protein TadG-related protein [Glaciibacter sp.]|nr:pilus assembly protein TadG-related protein [Glaciibacter sp.]